MTKTDTTGIEALVARVNIAVEILDKHPSEVYQGAILYRDLVSALERTQAVVKALSDLMDFVEVDLTSVSQKEWSAQREYVMSKAVDALAAVDAKPEGEA